MADIFELFKKIAPTEPVGPPTHMVVGLGNPGDKYTFTRHNAGFLALEYIAQKQNVKINRAKFRALTAQTTLAGTSCILLAPQTYMNNSGESVRECAAFYKIPPENIIVISDDVNLACGRLRVRKQGSDGGQKGLKSIISHLQTDAFPRIRIGVGSPPHPDMDRADWVLSEFTESEKKTIFDSLERVMGGIEKIISGDTDGAMQLCNSIKEG